MLVIYALSFVKVGIYWGHHHYMTDAGQLGSALVIVLDQSSDKWDFPRSAAFRSPIGYSL